GLPLFNLSLPCGFDMQPQTYGCGYNVAVNCRTSGGSCLGSAERQCGKPAIKPVLDVEDRIYGGSVAVPGSWPWQAQVYAGGHICGGALISDQHVLTAAHCVWNLSPSTFTVYLGSHHRWQSGASEVHAPVEETCVHPAWHRFGVPGETQDIAIIKLKRKVNMTRTIQPVCLPNHGEELTTGSKLYVTGWGEVGG
ncbi:unnamed protein product, partial [Ixodes persulcatus]